MSLNSAVWRNPRLSGRIPELDGIRGLAILLVLLYHYILIGTHPALHTWQWFAVGPLRFAWSGVDLFFVLSGFLIGGILYDARTSENYYRTFYFRRAYRILPIYFIWLALFMAGLYLAGPRSTGPVHSLFNRDLPWWSYFLFLQNFFMSAHRDFGPQWLRITWSLAVEEQFYLLLPWFVRNLRGRALIIVTAAAILGAPVFRFCLWLSGNDYYGPYTLLLSRADGLGMGVLIAMACRNERAWNWLAARRRYLYLALLLFGCGAAFLYLRHYVEGRPFYVFGISWVAAFYATLLALAVVNPGRIVMLIFGNSLLKRLGTVAYAVYIFHEGVHRLLYLVFFGTEPDIRDWPSLGVTLLSLAIVMLLAALSWRVLEHPLIRRAHAKYRYAPQTPQVDVSSSAPN